MPPTIEHERELHARGLARVAGVDEAGRGCWAGPVVAAALVLGPAALAAPELLEGVDDSKQLSAEQRELAYARVRALAEGVGLGVVPAYLIDAYGILPATRLAMQIAILSLPRPPEALLIDAVALPELGLPQHALIKGDARSLSIAAASIVAKVSRDRLMRGADVALPAYGFAAHKGYGTAAHARALVAHGPSHMHRHSFRPLIELWYDGQRSEGLGG